MAAAKMRRGSFRTVRSSGGTRGAQPLQTRLPLPLPLKGQGETRGRASPWLSLLHGRGDTGYGTPGHRESERGFAPLSSSFPLSLKGEGDKGGEDGWLMTAMPGVHLEVTSERAWGDSVREDRVPGYPPNIFAANSAAFMAKPGRMPMKRTPRQVMVRVAGDQRPAPNRTISNMYPIASPPNTAMPAAPKMAMPHHVCHHLLAKREAPQLRQIRLPSRLSCWQTGHFMA